MTTNSQTSQTTKIRTLRLLGEINADMRIGKWAKQQPNDALTIEDVWRGFPRGDLLMQLAGRAKKLDRKKIIFATSEIVQISRRYTAGATVDEFAGKILAQAETTVNGAEKSSMDTEGRVVLAAKCVLKAAGEIEVASCAGAASKAIWNACKAAEAAVANGCAPLNATGSTTPEEAFEAAAAEAADIIRKHISIRDLLS